MRMKRANEKKKKEEKSQCTKVGNKMLGTHQPCKISCVVVYTHLLCTTNNKLCSCVQLQLTIVICQNTAMDLILMLSKNSDHCLTWTNDFVKNTGKQKKKVD